MKQQDINQIPEQAHLIDVRERDEFEQGHIPGAVNRPLSEIQTWAKAYEGQQEPVYVYCLAGKRANQACQILRDGGVEGLVNLGGIVDYQGELE